MILIFMVREQGKAYERVWEPQVVQVGNVLEGTKLDLKKLLTTASYYGTPEVPSFIDELPNETYLLTVPSATQCPVVKVGKVKVGGLRLYFHLKFVDRPPQYGAFKTNLYF